MAYPEAGVPGGTGSLSRLAPAGRELFGLTLLISLLRHPHSADPDCADDRRLSQAVDQLIRRFAQLSGRTFSQEDALAEQLFFHLSTALERRHSHMGIDSSLQSEVEEKYPSMLRATRVAMIPLSTVFVSAGKRWG
ncbi:PRD domain-containing protein [Sodalis glossinidius]|uniref:PRD domain-containing protein n=1 Tax=Sodalis glossinidius TaxID=63612 RepID=UPI001412FF24|nr:PRD domain-containing protein [Sodalis glossinidius]